MSNDGDINPAVVEAVDWVVRFTSGEATHDDVRAFEVWRATDPANDAAFRALSGVRPIAGEIHKGRVSRRAVLGGGVAALGAAVMVGVARPPLGLWPSFNELMADHRTGPGQKFAFSPAAGVEVELNSRTSVNILSGGEGIQIVDGETFVAVARKTLFGIEARDVRFETAQATVNLDTLAGGVRLTCMEGKVDCIANGQSTRISANEQWRQGPAGKAAVRKVNAATSASWRVGVLQFSRTPLSEVVEQFNRYRSVPIMLSSSAAGSAPVSGVFYIEDTDAAVAQLQQLLQFRVRHLPGSVIVIS